MFVYGSTSNRNLFKCKFYQKGRFYKQQTENALLNRTALLTIYCRIYRNSICERERDREKKTRSSQRNIDGENFKANIAATSDHCIQTNSQFKSNAESHYGQIAEKKTPGYHEYPSDMCCVH